MTAIFTNRRWDQEASRKIASDTQASIDSAIRRASSDNCIIGDQWTTAKDDSFIRNLFEVNSCADSGVDEDGCSLYREDKDGCSVYREDKDGCGLYREDKDGDLIEELAAKEKDLLLAAELGKMLLEENQALQMALRRVTEECEKHVEEHERAEHELRRNLENVAAVYDARLSDVNAELRQVREGREELRRTSATYQRQTTTSINELREDNERLAGQLKEAARQRALLMAEVRQLRDVSTVKRHVTRDNTRQVDLLKEELQSRDRQLEEVYDSNSQLQERVNSMFLQLSTSRLDKCPSLYSELQSSQPSSQPGKLKQQTMADDNNIAFAQAPDSTNSFAVGSRRLSTSASHPSFPSSFSYQADIEDGADDGAFQMISARVRRLSTATAFYSQRRRAGELRAQAGGTGSVQSHTTAV
ncbi:PREDICTED: bicaudal D-related protein 1-like [Priapulus caudatus]|uniref:Bicaudal D-related protein 1-like n=1 Tax=Priapulus caudatus TaxID=37621 RepID=A0ABM1DR35_PRICU|nr:PREDICTED: bicaudal D-related protein 1-like [Priapulus caudatus]